MTWLSPACTHTHMQELKNLALVASDSGLYGAEGRGRLHPDGSLHHYWGWLHSQGEVSAYSSGSVGREREREGAAAAFTWVKSAGRVDKHGHMMCTEVHKKHSFILKHTHGLITLSLARGVSWRGEQTTERDDGRRRQSDILAYCAKWTEVDCGREGSWHLL